MPKLSYTLRGLALAALGFLPAVCSAAPVNLTTLPGVVIEVVRGNSKFNFADASDPNIIAALTDGNLGTSAIVTGGYRVGENGVTNTDPTEIGINIKFPKRWSVDEVRLGYDINMTAIATASDKAVTAIGQVFLEHFPLTTLVRETIDFTGPRGIGTSTNTLPKRLTNPVTLDRDLSTNQVRLRFYAGCGIDCRGMFLHGTISEIAVYGVPEPSALGLLLLGAPASALLLRRKRK